MQVSAKGFRHTIQFGPTNRSMMGIYHAPRALEPHRPAVLICNPFGQEAIRAFRVLLMLAERLADQGIPTLRFDYFGTGDSDGDGSEEDLHGWVEDILTADAALGQFAQRPTRAWIGLRLGATLAAKASVASLTDDRSLILWDPVLNGKQYLRELATADRAALLQGFSSNGRLYRQLRRQPVPEETTEALGFPLSPALRDQLRAVDAQGVGQVRARRCTVVAPSLHDPQNAVLANSMKACGIDPMFCRLDTPIDWATNDAGGRTIAPREAIKLIVPAILETSR